ncbi:hypothetical protein C0J52_04123 [Blattella germanica]|nr:hypothetical protein C0J52_04123 [Blattella germanica]
MLKTGSEHRVSSGGDQSESSYPRQQPTHVPEPPNEKQWNYSSLDLMGSGAAFWQNYSEDTIVRNCRSVVQLKIAIQTSHEPVYKICSK